MNNDNVKRIIFDLERAASEMRLMLDEERPIVEEERYIFNWKREFSIDDIIAIEDIIPEEPPDLPFEENVSGERLRQLEVELEEAQKYSIKMRQETQDLSQEFNALSRDFSQFLGSIAQGYYSNQRELMIMAQNMLARHGYTDDTEGFLIEVEFTFEAFSSVNDEVLEKLGKENENSYIEWQEGEFVQSDKKFPGTIYMEIDEGEELLKYIDAGAVAKFNVVKRNQ